MALFPKLFNVIRQVITCESQRIPTTILSRPGVANRLISQTKIRTLQSSTRRLGLEEFFDVPKNRGKRSDFTSGSPWTTDILRRKSLEDLQKLWYVLLKERNMLLTLERYCIEEDEPMPGPDRLEKVAESMSNLRDVITERESAKNVLLHGTPDGVQGEWRKNSLGMIYWYKYKEHLIPQHLQRIKKGDRPAELASFNKRLTEWHLRFREKQIKVRRSYYYRVNLKYRMLRGNNPHMPKKPPKWWMDKFRTKWRYNLHPELAVMLPPHDSRRHDGRPRFFRTK